MTKSKIIYDNVNYDYPNCGGIIIRLTPKNRVTVEFLSNMQGNRSNLKYKLNKSDSYQVLYDIEAGNYDIETGDLDYRLIGSAQVLNHGYIVQ